MYNYSKKSLKILNELHPHLKTLFLEVIKYVDVKLICGHRCKIEQNNAFKTGSSKLKWPKSKHNLKPSMAVDFELYPYSNKPIDIAYVSGLIFGISCCLNIKIRFGGDWNKNFRLSDEKFLDMFHIELIE